uniref:Uncharacterized protein n=1 Tax=Anopheles atroparvus TaxID=41427 RepID=A0A182IQ99_ANOAO
MVPGGGKRPVDIAPAAPPAADVLVTPPVPVVPPAVPTPPAAPTKKSNRVTPEARNYNESNDNVMQRNFSSGRRTGREREEPQTIPTFFFARRLHVARPEQSESVTWWQVVALLQQPRRPGSRRQLRLLRQRLRRLRSALRRLVLPWALLRRRWRL